jgi:hypothetical protein
MAIKNLSVKISEKGCVSVYGLRRFPISLYASEWEAILAKAPQIAAFCKAHASELGEKAESRATVKGGEAL